MAPATRCDVSGSCHSDPVPTLTDAEVAVAAESVCIHGDTPRAVVMARAVRSSLEVAGVEIRPFAG